MSHLIVFSNLWERVFFKLNIVVFNGEQEKESIIRVKGGIEKSVSPDHHMSSISKPHRVTHLSLNGVFLGDNCITSSVNGRKFSIINNNNLD